jgi:hypothetical protein
MLAFRQPKIMEVDSVLLQQVEELCSRETVHFRANFFGAYRSSLEEFECTRDDTYRLIAQEAHLTLRILLAKMGKNAGCRSGGSSNLQCFATAYLLERALDVG